VNTFYCKARHSVVRENILSYISYSDDSVFWICAYQQHACTHARTCVCVCAHTDTYIGHFGMVVYPYTSQARHKKQVHTNHRHRHRHRHRHTGTDTDTDTDTDTQERKYLPMHISSHPQKESARARDRPRMYTHTHTHTPHTHFPSTSPELPT